MSGPKLAAVALAALSSIVLAFVLIVVVTPGHTPSGGVKEAPVTWETPREPDEDPPPSPEPTRPPDPMSPGCPNCVW